MAEMKLKLKIMDLECLERLVSALGAWAEELATCEAITAAEKELFDAAVEIADAKEDEAKS